MGGELDPWSSTETHVMHLEARYPFGAEKWSCPTCGRSLLVRWEPFDQMIFHVGDLRAHHRGATGPLTIEAVHGEVWNSTEPDEALYPWLAWLAKRELDDGSNEA